MEDSIDPKWRKATFSGNGGSDCVEVGETSHAILVRDTKNRDGSVLAFSRTAWSELVKSVKTR